MVSRLALKRRAGFLFEEQMVKSRCDGGLSESFLGFGKVMGWVFERVCLEAFKVFIDRRIGLTQ